MHVISCFRGYVNDNLIAAVVTVARRLFYKISIREYNDIHDHCSSLNHMPGLFNIHVVCYEGSVGSIITKEGKKWHFRLPKCPFGRDSKYNQENCTL